MGGEPVSGSLPGWRVEVPAEPAKPESGGLGAGVSAAAEEDMDASVPITVIQPRRGWLVLDLRELWRFRELLWILVWRDIKVRYKQTAIGAAWAILQPLAAMAVFTLFFGRLAHMPSDGLPYPLFVYSGLLLWQFFARALGEASTSLVANERIVTKVYFPRLLLPASVVLAGLLDFAVAAGLLVVFMVYYGYLPSLTILTVPLFVGLAFLLALGVSLWLSALDAEFRDVRYTLPFLTQIWLFATPVVYPASLVPESWRVLYGLNPMVGVIEGFRWAVLGTARAPDPVLLGASALVVAVVLVSGLAFFRRMERTLADRI